MKTPAAATLLCSTVLVAAGCGGSGASSAAKQPTTSPATHATTVSDGQAMLERAVRTALQQNSRLSFYTLWHNKMPTWAQRSTRGPALNELRASAVQRRSQGLQIRHLSGRLEIVSVQIDPSYLRATAVVRANDRLRPYRAGRPLGRVIVQKERARIQLRRLDQSPRFVVWKVALLR